MSLSFGKLKFRSVEIQDLGFLHKVRNDKDVMGNNISNLPIALGMQEKWYYGMMINDRYKIMMAYVEEAERPIGYINIIDIDHVNKKVEVGGSLALEYRSKGFGKDIILGAASVGFDHMGMNRVYLKVFDDNKIAIHTYKKCGFIKDGVERKSIFKNGEYKDIILMSILKEEWGDLRCL